MTQRALKLGMIGGGRGAFIGGVHRMAARLDDSFRLVAGAFSSDARRSKESGEELGIAPDRVYGSWRELITGEMKRPMSERVDAVSIVTPNVSHFEIAMACVEAGVNVIIDKPMVCGTREADELVRAVDRAGVVFVVTYNYTGYPLVKHMSSLVRGGAIGAVRKVFVEYHQGWLATRLEETGQKQAAWRNDPSMAGAGGAIGDIGSHAENLLSSVTGLEIKSLCADLTSFVPGRKLDDDAAVLIRMSGGAKAVLTASQVCIGEENNLSIRVHGEKGSVSWRQEEPNHLTVSTLDGRTEIVSRGSGVAAHATRLPPGHPEGFIEGFANIYRGAAELIIAKRDGRVATGLGAEAPTVRDGARGVRFIERVVASKGLWVEF